LEVAAKNNIQIFATTHNLECIQYFKEVLEDEEFEKMKLNSRVITLRELSDKSIKAYTRTFEEFNYAMEKEFEIRGGNQ
jgi:AAA15 family ATPase/GTPase